MIAAEREALEALCSRIDHTAAISRILSQGGQMPADEQDAVRGVAETLNELAARMDAILNPPAI